jgi:hypothetical protein
LGDDLHVMKARCRYLTQILPVELGAPSCAKGGPNRDMPLEVRHQLVIVRHYADTRRPFADIRQHGSASWRIVAPKTFSSFDFHFGLKPECHPNDPLQILMPRTPL